MAANRDGVHGAAVDVVRATTGTVLTSLLWTDVVGAPGRAVKRYIAEKRQEVPYIQLKLIGGDGTEIGNDDIVTEEMLFGQSLAQNGQSVDQPGESVAARAAQLQLVVVPCRRGTDAEVRRVKAEGLGWDAVVVRNFLEASHDPNAVYEVLGGRALLHCALHQGQPEAMRFLLAAWADANLECENGETPVMAGLRSGFCQSITIRALVARRADVNRASQKLEGQTPLHVAASQDQAMHVALLLECRADATMRSRSTAGETPAHIAAQQGDVEAARMLQQAADGVEETGKRKRPRE